MSVKIIGNVVKANGLLRMGPTPMWLSSVDGKCRVERRTKVLGGKGPTR